MSWSAFRRVVTYLFVSLGCVVLEGGNVVAQAQEFVQIDVEVVSENPNGIEVGEVDGKLYLTWDSTLGGTIASFFAAPDPKICFDDNGTMRCTSNCPDVYFCSFIGVPVTTDNFLLEVRDYDDSTFFSNPDDVIGKGTCGINRVCQLGAARVTITALPCNDQQIQVKFYEEAVKGRYLFDSGFEPFSQAQQYHRFSFPGRICKVGNRGCDVKTVFSTMISQVRFLAPSESTLPVKHCGINELKHYVSPNPVRTTVDAQTSTIVNYTLKGHLFYPGKITRRVVTRDGWVVVITEGEGIGQMADINELFGEALFADINADLAEAVRRRSFFPAGRPKKRR